MTITFNKFDAFVANLANGGFNLGADTLKVMLSNTLPVRTNAVKADITEIAAGSGYSAGGLTVTGVTSAQTTGTYKLSSSAAPVLTASGTLPTFRYAVLYDSTTNDLIGWWDYGASLVLNATDTFTVNFDAVNGLLQLQ